MLFDLGLGSPLKNGLVRDERRNTVLVSTAVAPLGGEWNELNFQTERGTGCEDHRCSHPARATRTSAARCKRGGGKRSRSQFSVAYTRVRHAHRREARP